MQTHLAHMFAKLDIATRAQLAADVTRHQGSEQKPGFPPDPDAAGKHAQVLSRPPAIDKPAP